LRCVAATIGAVASSERLATRVALVVTLCPGGESRRGFSFNGKSVLVAREGVDKPSEADRERETW
jgi:hypothetical protein